jgi:hypothetical protein
MQPSSRARPSRSRSGKKVKEGSTDGGPVPDVLVKKQVEVW